MKLSSIFKICNGFFSKKKKKPLVGHFTHLRFPNFFLLNWGSSSVDRGCDMSKCEFFRIVICGNQKKKEKEEDSWWHSLREKWALSPVALALFLPPSCSSLSPFFFLSSTSLATRVKQLIFLYIEFSAFSWTSNSLFEPVIIFILSISNIMS